MSVSQPPTLSELKSHPVVSSEEWLEARRRLLEKERQVTRLNDELSTERRKLPWTKVDKTYVFETTLGRQTLAELFGGRSQLIIYHFMFGPGWKEGCDGCSFLSDHFDGANLHLAHHDVTLLAVSRAPLAEFLPFKKRMGWKFKWVSSHDSDFNFDFHASADPERQSKALYNYEEIDAADSGGEHHGISVFFKDSDGAIYHTYSCYARGVDSLCTTHNFLDLTPKGRNERSTMDWVKLHDQYESEEDTSGCRCGK
ncbi:MAG: thioredoxin family protein [Opitutales bacterium]|nr:thioredoxin family protein [Opitutales bacterium]